MRSKGYEVIDRHNSIETLRVQKWKKEWRGRETEKEKKERKERKYKTEQQLKRRKKDKERARKGSNQYVASNVNVEFMQLQRNYFTWRPIVRNQHFINLMVSQFMVKELRMQSSDLLIWLKSNLQGFRKRRRTQLTHLICEYVTDLGRNIFDIFNAVLCSTFCDSGLKIDEMISNILERMIQLRYEKERIDDVEDHERLHGYQCEIRQIRRR